MTDLKPEGLEAARNAVRYLSHSETPWSDEQVAAVINAYLTASPPAPAESGAVAITDDLVDAIHFVYQMKVREYDADFRNDMLPEGAWEEKYGTNLHATSLGEKWALKQAMIAVNTHPSTAPSASAESGAVAMTVHPMETAPRGDDAMEPVEIEIHEGSWAIVLGTNAKPIGWIDTHEAFAGRTYRNNLLHPAPSASMGRVTDAMVEAAQAVLQQWGMEHGWRTAARLALQAALDSPPDHGGGEGVSAAEIANEIWEQLFNGTKDAVPDGITDAVLLKVADAIVSGYEIKRRAA